MGNFLEWLQNITLLKLMDKPKETILMVKSLILAVSAMLAREKPSTNPLLDNEVKQSIELLETVGKVQTIL